MTNISKMSSAVLLSAILMGVAFTSVNIQPAFAPPTGSWGPGAPITTAVEGYGAAEVGNIHFYIAGFGPGGDSNLNQRYDRAADAWLANGAPIPGPARAELGAVSTDGSVYAVGGRIIGAVAGAIQRYDPPADAWTPFAGAGALTPMSIPVASEHSVVNHGGKIYVTGGRAGIADSPQTGGDVSALQIYDIASDTWSLGMPLPFTLSDAAAVAHGNKIYVFGGFSTDPAAPLGPGVLQDSTLIYNIPIDSWALGAPMPAPTANASAGKCGNKMHVVGGGPIFALTGAHHVYDPVKDVWALSTPLPGGQITGEAQAISTAGSIFIVGGGIFGTGAFNPVQNVWKCAP